MEEKMGWKGGMDGWMEEGRRQRRTALQTQTLSIILFIRTSSFRPRLPSSTVCLITADGKSSSGRQQQTATAAAGVAHTAHSNAFCMLCVWLP
ncbi:hypothetical protein X798_02290 [Onchocerca flexuosa]|uniref:Uncharacterized protein n=1 Tax=Onchocerca flexuosa TaxID=387005 RepID=A0A238BZ54_9BILA|nr:hypothetical protein X798_02290 [Onchocerca flexuosa]